MQNYITILLHLKTYINLDPRQVDYIQVFLLSYSLHRGSSSFTIKWPPQQVISISITGYGLEFII